MTRICEDAGVLLAYLPPYSPDFNPIEVAFGQLKQWLKKNRILAGSFDSFEDFLRLGMEQVQTAAKGHFRRCRLGRMFPRDDDDMYGDVEEGMDENEYY